MKKTFGSIALLCLVLMQRPALAQEHYTEGPVWAISSYQVNEGQWDEYAKWMRTYALRIFTEAKKQGLVQDFKVFTQERGSPKDWDFAVATLHPSYGAALDYSAANEAKWDAIAAEVFSTADKEKQDEMAAGRFKMRKFLGTRYVREITLKPMPE
jgi:hypothetical protein